MNNRRVIFTNQEEINEFINTLSSLNINTSVLLKSKLFARIYNFYIRKPRTIRKKEQKEPKAEQKEQKIDIERLKQILGVK